MTHHQLFSWYFEPGTVICFCWEGFIWPETQVVPWKPFHWLCRSFFRNLYIWMCRDGNERVVREIKWPGAVRKATAVQVITPHWWSPTRHLMSTACLVLIRENVGMIFGCTFSLLCKYSEVSEKQTNCFLAHFLFLCSRSPTLWSQLWYPVLQLEKYSKL